MTLRERFAIAICSAPEHAWPRLSSDGCTVRDAPMVAMVTQCVCERDGRIPDMGILRCADCLAKADQVIDLFPELGIMPPLSVGWPTGRL